MYHIIDYKTNKEHMKRQRLTIHKNISFNGQTADKIQTIAEQLNVSFQDIVRECVDIELPKLTQRELRRTKRGQNADK